MAEYEAFSSSDTQDLVSCGICGRNFNPQALSRHQPICSKGAQKKRKVFDMAKQRAEGTEIKAAAKKGAAGRGAPAASKRLQPGETNKKKNNWRQTHQEFVSAIRNARGVQRAMETGAPLPPPPPPSINPDYIQCDYCGRRFNETAAERHTKFCKEQHERLPNKKKVDAVAMQRSNARSNYAVPKPVIKSPNATPPSSFGNHPTHPTSHGPMPAGRGSAGSLRTGASASSSATASRTANTKTANGKLGGGYYDDLDAARSPGGSNGGRALRTGRTAETYSEARQLSAKQRTSMGGKSPKYGGLGHTSPGNSNPVPVSTGTGSSGYHNNGDSLHRGGSGITKFCHECGTKYPVPQAKFCCECGLKRVQVV